MHSIIFQKLNIIQDISTSQKTRVGQLRRTHIAAIHFSPFEAEISNKGIFFFGKKVIFAMKMISLHQCYRQAMAHITHLTLGKTEE